MRRTRASRDGLATAVIAMIAALCVGAVVADGRAADAPSLDRSPASDEVSYRPEDGEQVAANPPAFVWLPVQGVKSWLVQYSPAEDFSAAGTVTVEDLTMMVHIPTRTLQPGTWYWRYGYLSPNGPVYSRSRQFVIPEDAVAFPFPGVQRLLDRIPRTRPRVYFTSETVSRIRAEGEAFAWLTEPTIRSAEAVLKRDEPLFTEPQPWKQYENPRAAYIDAYRDAAVHPRDGDLCSCLSVYGRCKIRRRG